LLLASLDSSEDKWSQIFNFDINPLNLLSLDSEKEIFNRKWFCFSFFVMKGFSLDYIYLKQRFCMMAILIIIVVEQLE
jgi:hypothetical protein